MLSPYELLEILIEKYSAEEIIIIINNLIYDLEKDSRKYINELSILLEDYALSKDKCPLCTNEIETVVVDNEEREYQGFKCYESIHMKECSDPSCPYTAN